MTLNYNDRMLRKSDQAGDRGPVRVRRSFGRFPRGHVIEDLPASKRRQLIRTGFVEPLEDGVGGAAEAPAKKKAAKKKAAKKKAAKA